MSEPERELEVNSFLSSPPPGKRRYNIKLWKTFTDCFNCLPIAAIVDDKIFCCHGGNSSNSWYRRFLGFRVLGVQL